MRKIRLIWIGRSKEPFVREGVKKYLSLINPYVAVDVLELKEARTDSRKAALEREGKLILRKTRSFILFDEKGRETDSIEFSRCLEGHLERTPELDLVIGGPYGVSGDVRAAALDRLSLSRMTFTHQMVRIVLLEQIYRAFTIMRGKTYHY